MKTYKDLLVYKNSYKLSILIHKISQELPREVFDIKDQMTRCSRSIPTNIAEGYTRNKSIKDRINFLRTSLGSNGEMFTHLSFLRDLGYIDEKIINGLIEAYELNGKRINKLISFNSEQNNQKTKKQNN